MQEVDLETIRRSLMVVDFHEATLKEAGDRLIPLPVKSTMIIS